MSELNVYCPVPLCPEYQVTQPLSLMDLKRPAQFDAVKHGIDQSSFFDLMLLYQQDDVLMCRKAELFISIQSFHEAADLLKGNNSLLARALRCKLYFCLNQDGQLIKTASPYLWLSPKEVDSFCEAEKEALVHFFEMMALYAAKQDLLVLTSLLLKRAAALAVELGMQGRFGILKNHSRVLKLDLFESNQLTFQDHNVTSKRYESIETLIDSWKEGEPVVDSFLADYEPVVKAWQLLQSRQWLSAFETLKPSKDPSVTLLSALVRITVAVHLGRGGEFKESIQLIRTALAQIKVKGNVIDLAKSVFPLAFLLAAELIPEFSEYKTSIPILSNEGYRDGLRYKHKVITLPNAYRKAWFDDNVRPHDFSQLKALNKTVRFRAREKLKEHDLKPFNIVSSLSYLQAASYCSSLGYEAFNVLVEKLTTDYPKVKNYLA